MHFCLFYLLKNVKERSRNTFTTTRALKEIAILKKISGIFTMFLNKQLCVFKKCGNKVAPAILPLPYPVPVIEINHHI